MGEIRKAKKVIVELNTSKPLPQSSTREELQLMREGHVQEADARQRARATKLLAKRLRNEFFFRRMVGEGDEFADPLLAIILDEFKCTTQTKWERPTAKIISTDPKGVAQIASETIIELIFALY